MQHLEQQLAFIRELDRLKSVYRQSLVKSDDNRFENSAEHSWHICIIANVLREYVDEPLDIDRAIRMLLIHDIVEIDAGDTFAFADTNAKAVDRVVPVFMNMANEGGGWRRHKIRRSQLLKRNEFLRTTMPRIWDFVASQIDLAVSQGWLQED